MSMKNLKSMIRKNFRGVIDSTLREGFQFAKANFSLEEQKTIYSYLAGIGVEFVEVGNPAKPEIERRILELVKMRRGSAARILCHVRNHESDVRKAIDSGVDGVNILCTADAERLAALNKTREGYMEVLGRNIRAAKASGLIVRVGVEDFFGQPPGTSFEIYNLAEASGADRIAIADTLGKAMGWEVSDRIRDLRRRTVSPLEVHFHNDLGHAVSNAMAALRAGASYVSASLLGIGERTGITPLSSLFVNLYVLDATMADRYDLSLLTEAENYVSRICDIEMPPHLLTNPANGFAHKAGIHLDALIKFGPQKYEAFSPRLIGNSRKMVINTLVSGKTGPKDLEEFEQKYG
jgi:homocitrate synthase